MSDLNLNNPNDFAALTSAFGSVFGQPQQQTWNIVQSSFKSVPFHIFASPAASGILSSVFGVGSTTPAANSPNYDAAVPRVHDRTGRRKIYYQFPFQDGQTSGDLGRKPFIFEFDVVFFGPNYFTGYQALYNVLNQPTPGVLRHPVLGDIECVPDDWEVVHESAARLSLAMRVVFQEHTYDPGLTFQNVPALNTAISTGSPSTLKSAVTAALSVFQSIDAVTTAVRANKAYLTSFANGVKNLVTGLKQSYLLSLQSIYLSFAPDAVTTAPDLPGVLPVNLGGVLNASGVVTSSLYPLTNSSNSPFSEISTPATANPQLTPIQAQNQVNAVLQQVEGLVTTLNNGNGGNGSLDFYDQVLSLKQSAVLLKIALIKGIASSNNITTSYTVPPTIPFMSIFEVAFAIGLDVNFSDQLRILNPQLLSVNQIPGGTVLQIPVAA